MKETQPLVYIDIFSNIQNKIKGIFDEFRGNNILIGYGLEISFVRKLTFGLHVSSDAHGYSLTRHNFAKLILKVHFIMQYFS